MTRTYVGAAAVCAVAFSLLSRLTLAPAARAADRHSLSKMQIKALVATAKTPDEHMKLARHFNEGANRLEAEAGDHEELAQEYRKNPSPIAMKTPMSPNSAEHCVYFAKAARDAAKAARELANSHQAMAKHSK